MLLVCRYRDMASTPRCCANTYLIMRPRCSHELWLQAQSTGLSLAEFSGRTATEKSGKRAKHGSSGSLQSDQYPAVFQFGSSGLHGHGRQEEFLNDRSRCTKNGPKSRVREGARFNPPQLETMGSMQTEENVRRVQQKVSSCNQVGPKLQIPEAIQGSGRPKVSSQWSGDVHVKEEIK